MNVLKRLKLFLFCPRTFTEDDLTNAIIKFALENYQWKEQGRRSLSCEELNWAMSYFYYLNGEDKDKLNLVYSSTCEALKEECPEAEEFLASMNRFGLLRYYYL